LERAATGRRERQVGRRAAALERLLDGDVAGVLELAQVGGEVAGGHVEDLLQPGEGDPVAAGQPGERGDHAQPGLGVDDRVQLELAHASLRASSAVASAATRKPPPPATACTRYPFGGVTIAATAPVTANQAPSTNIGHSRHRAPPAM